MGGKGSATAPPPITTATQPSNNDMEQMAMMMQMMAAMSGGGAEAGASAYIPPAPPSRPLPEIKKPINRDWAEEYSKLRNKARADYAAQTKKQYGRAATVHSSPLLDEEESTTSSPVPKVGA